MSTPTHAGNALDVSRCFEIGNLMPIEGLNQATISRPRRTTNPCRPMCQPRSLTYNRENEEGKAETSYSKSQRLSILLLFDVTKVGQCFNHFWVPGPIKCCSIANKLHIRCPSHEVIGLCRLLGCCHAPLFLPIWAWVDIGEGSRVFVGRSHAFSARILRVLCELPLTLANNFSYLYLFF